MRIKFKIQNSKFKIYKILLSKYNLLKKNTGQIVLILVLVTVVGLTVGLSLVSRTVTDIRISSQIEQSNRAFTAAEAGVESALKGAVIGGPTGIVSLADYNVTANYNVSAIGGTNATYSFPITETNNSQTVWLTDHNADGSLDESTTYSPDSELDICWGSGDTNPAVIFTLFYKEGTEYKITKGAYDPATVSRGVSNYFLTANSVGSYCDGSFKFKKTIKFSSASPDGFGISSSSKLLALRIRPLYENTILAVKPPVGTNLPVQGKIITSVGKTDTGVVRKMQVIQSYPILPAQLDYTLFTED